MIGPCRRSSAWHKDVGTILMSSVLIQTAVAMVAWAVPWAVFVVKRRLKRGAASHRYDMEALWEGPPIDLPKFVGKAYACAFIVIVYGGVLPLLYAIGALFFLGTWAGERFNLLRVHRTPPPYSFELIHATLWWLPWAVTLHLGVTFWGYASLPATPLGDGVWTAPYALAANVTLEALLSGVANVSAASPISSAALLGGLGAGDSAGVVLDALAYAYDLPAHVNSYATLTLFVPAAVLLVVMLLAMLRATPLYIPFRPIEAALVAAAGACAGACSRGRAKVAPDVDSPLAAAYETIDVEAFEGEAEEEGGGGARVVEEGGAEVGGDEQGGDDDVGGDGGDAEGVGAAEGGQGAEGATTGAVPRPPVPRPPVSKGKTHGQLLQAMQSVVDPPFSKVLRGVYRPEVRMLDGKIVHEMQRGIRQTLCTRAAEFTPTALAFRAVGMLEEIDPVTEEQWARATPLFTKLTRAADISYQPEFHPTYEKAFFYLSHPERLAAFAEANAAPVAAAAAAVAAAAATDDDTDAADEKAGDGDAGTAVAGASVAGDAPAPASPPEADGLAVQDVAESGESEGYDL